MLSRSFIGYELPPLEVEVDRWRLRGFARAIGETNPLFVDVDAARAAGYRDLLAPPTFLFGLSYDMEDQTAHLREMGADPREILHGEQSFRYHEPICAGDRLTMRSRIVDIYAKKGGALEFIVRESGVFNDRGHKVAELRETLVLRHATPAGSVA
jgi:acyl dehydratase